MSQYFVRFSLKQRIEHLVTMVVFTGLCLTGFPQKFYTAGWAQAIVGAVGGIDATRWIHRALGFALAASTLVHFAGAFGAVLRKRVAYSIVPTQQDFKDAIATLKYYLGMADQPARFDRFDYKQKWEYWGLVVGNVIMILSGLILIYPGTASLLVPGQVIPAAKVAHSNEGLMAFLVITIWHIFNAHLNPDVFPFDASIFTGKISRERMEHEHPLELARLEGGAVPGHGGAAPPHANREVG
jgi:formate dehydrogenase subunit gamma